MYLTKVKIENIRSIENFQMEFTKEECPGWHVLLGDNGAGKTTIVRAISVGLLGLNDSQALRQNWHNWISFKKLSAKILMTVIHSKKKKKFDYPIEFNLSNSQSQNINKASILVSGMGKTDILSPPFLSQNKYGPWFSAAYGPHRRFSGSNSDIEKIQKSNPRASAHITAFGEDIALTESIEWLKTLHYKRLENPKENSLIEDVKNFINNGKLLPHGAVIEKINTDGVFFKDGNNVSINISELSDGYRSVLSLTLDLLFRLIKEYGQEKVFDKTRKEKTFIDVPGIVLIDEIDAHLHPTWQIKIGKWFTQYFPKIQFIVTTHSPLICRSAVNGSIWRLAAPGSDEESKRIIGKDYERLIYGNILEAYGTEVFGENISRADFAHEKLDRMAELNLKSIRGSINIKEKEELNDLQGIFPTGI